MAVIQLNGIISNIKGSIGGVTFSNVRSGIALKRKLAGRKNVNSKQLTALNTNKSSANTWRALTFGDKENWNTFALTYTFTNRYGQTVALTGFNWFTSINTNRVLLGSAISGTVPSYILPDALPVFFITMSATAMTVTFSTTVDTATVAILVYASGPTRGQPQYNRGAYRLLSLPFVDYSSTFDITSAWEVATGLVYTEVISLGSPNINVLIVPVSKTSYISGVGQSATSQLPASGIGVMVIGTTFIVS